MQGHPRDTGDVPPEGTAPVVVIPVVDAKTGLASERTKLARFRTALAIDRTTLAWIRTALTSAAFGFGLIGVFRTIAPMAQSQEARHLHEAAIFLAVAMVAIGMLGAIARPDDILFTADLPKTRSGKIMRRLLRDIAEGKALGDTTTLADPGVVAKLKANYEEEYG